MGPIQPFELVPVKSDDEDFLFRLYSSGRMSEVMGFGWAAAETEAFLRMQFSVREKFFRIQYPNAESSLLVINGRPIGRLLVARHDKLILLIDIAVAPESQGKGIATSVVSKLQAEAVETGSKVRLSVDPINTAALSIYSRLGFAVASKTDTTISMEWEPGRNE